VRQHHVFIRTNDLSGNLIKKIIYCNLYMDLHISFTVYLLCSISSAGADQCSENCTLTDVAQPVTVCILRVTDCVLVAACLSTDNTLRFAAKYSSRIEIQVLRKMLRASQKWCSSEECLA